MMRPKVPRETPSARDWFAMTGSRTRVAKLACVRAWIRRHPSMLSFAEYARRSVHVAAEK